MIFQEFPLFLSLTPSRWEEMWYFGDTSYVKLGDNYIRIIT